MMYVDLNPIRAGIHKTPELSEYTSIQERLVQYKKSFSEDKKKRRKLKTKTTTKTPFPPIENYAFTQLLPFMGDHNQQKNSTPGIDFHLQDYFTLLDWTGRAIRQDKRGAIPANILPLMERLQVNEGEWVNMVNHFGRRFYRVIGPVEAVKKIGKQMNEHWVKGIMQCRRLYKSVLDTNPS